MAEMTITEGLAEIPTILKRIEKKREFIRSYLYRQANTRDPHEKDGGSAAILAQEFQAIQDLQTRVAVIRRVIQAANLTYNITIGKITLTIADWLTWRREMATNEQRFFSDLSQRLNSVRSDAARKGVGVTDQDKGYSTDVVVNLNEKALAAWIEETETILGALDGQLSLKNATIMIKVP